MRLDFHYQCMGLAENTGSLRRFHDITEGEADPALRGVMKTEPLQSICHRCCSFCTGGGQTFANELLQVFLRHGIVPETQTLRENLIEEQTPQCRLDARATHLLC